MADSKPIQKSYNEAGDQSEAFVVRTMKKDLERLRQGLPLREASLSAKSFTPQDSPRRLSASIGSHNPLEQPSKEVATPPPKPENRMPSSPPGTGLQGFSGVRNIPIIPPKPPLATITLPPQIIRTPIEATKPQVRPVPSVTTVPVGKMERMEDVGERGKFLNLFYRIFPSRKRLLGGLLIFVLVLLAGAYGLFAYFGKPLPGTKYLPTPSKSPQTASLSPSPQPSHEPPATPSIPALPTPSLVPTWTRTSYLPVSRLARIILPQTATQATLLDRLANFSLIAQIPGDFSQILVRRDFSDAPLEPKAFFNFLDIKAPEELFAELSGDLTLFFYAPRGIPPNAKLKNTAAHIGFLIPVKGSPETVKDILRRWEPTLSGDLSLLALGRSWHVGPGAFFTPNVYQGTTVRYQNFPDPYLSIDYAVFEGTQPPLLIVTTSRESMFSVIGTLNFRSE